MTGITSEIMAKTIEYFRNIEELETEQPPVMLVDFVLEKYKDLRNYPSSYTEEKIEADIRKHSATIAMGVVDVYMKIGAEGETSHQEKNISRVYENAYISSSIFADVLPFVKIF